MSLKEITLTDICLSLATGTCALGASKELRRTMRRRHRDTTAELAGLGLLVKVCSCLEQRFLSLSQWKCRSWHWVRQQTLGETPKGSLCPRTARPAEKQQRCALPTSRLFKYCHRKHQGLGGFAVRNQSWLLESPKTHPGGVSPALPWLTWHLQEPAVDTECWSLVDHGGHAGH